MSYTPPANTAADISLAGEVIPSSEGWLYLADGLEDIADTSTAGEGTQTTTASGITDTLVGAATQVTGLVLVSSDTVNSAQDMVSATFTYYLEAVASADSLVTNAVTTSALLDSAVIRDTIQQAINQIVADAANGTDVVNLGAALTLVDIANAVSTETSTHTTVMLVAEIIATLESLNSVASEDVTDTSALSDVYVNRVSALVEMLEEHYLQDVSDVTVHVIQLASDQADGTTTTTINGSLITALLDDTVLATIRLSIGGELYTGWVLNTDTLAPSEYQFADLQFNSACKHGTKYLLAADDGIYEFTEAPGVETVMSYIKTGKTDFGSDLKKRIVNSYMVYSASDEMVLKVTTSEYGQLVTRNYRMVPPTVSDTTDVRRFDLGRGIKSRYWQFELVGDGVDCDIDEIGMLPVVLSRRI